jgi:hypothetical protein
MGVVLAIDPGPLRSAWVLLDDGLPKASAYQPNEQVVESLRQFDLWNWEVVIEKVESFGMAVGVEVFETVFWSGRFAEAAHPLPVHRIGRKAIKLHLCHTTKAKDSNVRQALVDRYGGKDAAIGRKAAPGALYGISGDVWSALAVAVTYADGVR